MLRVEEGNKETMSSVHASTAKRLKRIKLRKSRDVMELDKIHFCRILYLYLKSDGIGCRFVTQLQLGIHSLSSVMLKTQIVY